MSNLWTRVKNWAHENEDELLWAIVASASGAILGGICVGAGISCGRFIEKQEMMKELPDMIGAVGFDGAMAAKEQLKLALPDMADKIESSFNSSNAFDIFIEMPMVNKLITKYAIDSERLLGRL